MTKIMIMGILMCGGAGAIAAETPIEVANSRADARTPEAVKAADAAWLDAEINGDYKFLEWFLLDGYESIDATGSIFSRAALIENRRRRGRSDEFAKQVREWREQHPNHAEVKIYRDTAVLTWVADDRSSKTPIYSCDIFIYQKAPPPYTASPSRQPTSPKPYGRRDDSAVESNLSHSLAREPNFTWMASRNA